MALITKPSVEEKKSTEETTSAPMNPPAPNPIPKGFKAITLKRFHKADCSVVLPNSEGYFIPTTQEEYDILTWHAQFGKVILEMQ